jgi:hypothetical protein
MKSKAQNRGIISILDIKSKKLQKVHLHSLIIIQRANVIIKVKISVRLVLKKIIINRCNFS